MRKQVGRVTTKIPATDKYTEQLAVAAIERLLLCWRCIWLWLNAPSEHLARALDGKMPCRGRSVRAIRGSVPLRCPECAAKMFRHLIHSLEAEQLGHAAHIHMQKMHALTNASLSFKLIHVFPLVASHSDFGMEKNYSRRWQSHATLPVSTQYCPQLMRPLHA